MLIARGRWAGRKGDSHDPSIFTVVHICAYNESVHFEWDPSKAATNLTKHGIHFADAVGVFEDDVALTIRDPYLGDEERWITIGMDMLGRILVVVYTWRGQGIRLISARSATPRERRQYEENDET
jgi:uncharacterized DUF497 family protein